MACKYFSFGSLFERDMVSSSAVPKSTSASGYAWLWCQKWRFSTFSSRCCSVIKKYISFFALKSWVKISCYFVLYFLSRPHSVSSDHNHLLPKTVLIIISEISNYVCKDFGSALHCPAAWVKHSVDIQLWHAEIIKGASENHLLALLNTCLMSIQRDLFVWTNQACSALWPECKTFCFNVNHGLTVRCFEWWSCWRVHVKWNRFENGSQRGKGHWNRD